MINAREGGQRRDFLRLAGLVVGSALLNACAPGISKLSPTEAIAPPTLAPTKVATADTATRLPETPAIPKDQMDKIVTDLNADLQGGYALSPNPDGTYVVKGPDGQAVKNIRLNVDGKVNLTLPDGKVESLPPETVFMPTTDKIYAGLDQIEVKGGAVSEIPIKDTYLPSDPSKSPVAPSLGDWVRWMRDQSEKSGDLDREFEKADETMKWKLDTNISYPWDIYNDGNLVSSSMQELMPTGLAPDSFNPSAIPRIEVIPTRYYPSLVRLYKIPGVSLIPVYFENSSPIASHKYALFPGVVGSNQINVPGETQSYDLRWILADKISSSGVPIKTWLTVGLLKRGSTVDGMLGKVTIPWLIEGVDASADVARLNILKQGIQSGSFDGSENFLWSISFWFARR